MNKVLTIEDLDVSFGELKVVHGLSIDVHRGKVLGIVGESGSGKSVSMMSILGLIPKARIKAGQVNLYTDETTFDLKVSDSKEMRHVLRNHVSFVFQEPMTALNPLMRCGKQVSEAIISAGSKADKRHRILELFTECDLPDPERIYTSYPHQISGGQRQRVMIAMALANDPALLIADEPTTALDPLVQSAVVELLVKACKSRNMGLIFISHDLDLVSGISDRICVMEKGVRVEYGDAKEIFNSPKESYTKHLLNSRPRYSHRTEEKKPIGEIVLNASDIHKVFSGRGEKSHVALQNVSFSLNRGETLGLIGESGSGKSTLGRIIVKLTEPDGGTIDLSLGEKPFYRKVQMVFQDPYSSLNPKQTIGDAIAEPLLFHGICSSKTEARKRGMELLESVDLDPAYFDRYPHEFSGGQRQRVCIARALSVEPDILVCDESVSALDVSVQAHILDLLMRLQKERDLSYLFIAHDMNVVTYLCNRIIVLKNGKIEEEGETPDMVKNPVSPYTKLLLNTIVD